jgi:hypothetical protein
MRLVIAKAFLFGVLVFFVIDAVVVAYVVYVLQHNLSYFASHSEFNPYFGASVVLGVATSVASYFPLRKRTETRIRELSDLIDQLKSPAGHEEASNALLATRKMLEALPEIAKPRYQDALVLGLIAFLVVTLTPLAAVGLFVGLAVFLYFRYEAKRTYERELASLDNQRKTFEEKMDSFAQTL